MENGSFQFLQLADLDFADQFQHQSLDMGRAPSRAEEPGKMKPQPAIVKSQVIEIKDIPSDLRKSNTIEALISQNEDLMARLKVTLKRLSEIEDKNKAFETEAIELRQSYGFISDQMLIWKEKEKVWKSRNQGLEKEVQVFRDRFPDLQKMEESIERYKRYHERVKTQIKPYIAELKGYAQALQSRIAEHQNEIDQKALEINELHRKLHAQKEVFESQYQAQENSQRALVSHFEDVRDRLEKENISLKEDNLRLESKAEQLNQALERQDELENLVIALRRAKEEYQNQIHSEIEDLRTQASDYKRLVTEKDILLEDLKGEFQRLQNTLANTEAQRSQNEEQLSSLRFLWSNKCDELEKAKLGIASLERINLDLSTKLNDIRKSQAAF